MSFNDLRSTFVRTVDDDDLTILGISASVDIEDFLE
jgi:hypothetical protein